MNIKKLILLPTLAASFVSLGACSSASSNKLEVVYQVTFTSNDSCTVYLLDASMSGDKYGDGWTLKQFEDIFFQLSKDNQSFIYSFNRYGYYIVFNKNGD